MSDSVIVGVQAYSPVIGPAMVTSLPVAADSRDSSGPRSQFQLNKATTSTTATTSAPATPPIHFQTGRIASCSAQRYGTRTSNTAAKFP